MWSTLSPTLVLLAVPAVPLPDKEQKSVDASAVPLQPYTFEAPRSRMKSGWYHPGLAEALLSLRRLRNLATRFRKDQLSQKSEIETNVSTLVDWLSFDFTTLNANGSGVTAAQLHTVSHLGIVAQYACYLQCFLALHCFSVLTANSHRSALTQMVVVSEELRSGRRQPSTLFGLQVSWNVVGGVLVNSVNHVHFCCQQPPHVAKEVSDLMQQDAVRVFVQSVMALRRKDFKLCLRFVSQIVAESVDVRSVENVLQHLTAESGFCLDLSCLCSPIAMQIYLKMATGDDISVAEAFKTVLQFMLVTLNGCCLSRNVSLRTLPNTCPPSLLSPVPTWSSYSSRFRRPARCRKVSTLPANSAVVALVPQCYLGVVQTSSWTLTLFCNAFLAKVCVHLLCCSQCAEGSMLNRLSSPFAGIIRVSGGTPDVQRAVVASRLTRSSTMARLGTQNQQVIITKNVVLGVGLLPTVIVGLPNGALRRGKWYGLRDMLL